MIKISYLDFWCETKNSPVKLDEIDSIDVWNNLLLSRDLIKINNGVGLFHIDYLSKILNKNLIVTNPENADLIICSIFGNMKYLYPNTKKLLLSYESKNLPFDNLPNTIYFSSFLKANNNDFYYLPLHTCYYGFKIYDLFTKPRQIISEDEFNKKQNCISIISNNNGSFRNVFLDKLICKLPIDNYGKFRHNKDNNIIQSSCWYDKRLCNIINTYKFMICMENTSMNGYHTEKIMHGFRNNIIPIYWGDPVCQVIFNPNAYINVNSMGIDNAINKILELCNNFNDYNKMLSEPILHNKSVLHHEQFKHFLYEENFIKKINDFLDK